MNKVRFGIIGIGNMGSSHCRNLTAGLIPEGVLSAVCDISPERREWAKQTLPPEVDIFENTDAFFAKANIDVVLIAVPHYLHPPLAIEGFKHHLHVISEKPAGVYTAQVREMNEAASKSDRLFGMMFNQRTNPVYKKVKDLLESGELGEMQRVIWIITNWYRSQSYYDSGGWRATWAGEGGGVLLNQCPHQLDLWQWICGMPCRIRAFMQYGKGRDIEVENDVTAYAEYPNGATGLFVTSTCETPGTNRLEIAGDRGKIVVENDVVTFFRNRVGEKQFNAEYKGGFGNPECWEMRIPTPGENLQHVGILRNFCSAVLHGTPLLAPGEEGIRGLSISNAMHLSNWTDQWVDPNHLDEALFYELLQEKIRNSTQSKKSAGVTLDVSGTY